MFSSFDDLSLARWMAQTLGQIDGKSWRLSHPLIGCYRLASQIGNERGVWLKRLATVPAAYSLAPCCRAPFLPLLTRDVVDSGLLCQHCNETLVPLAELPDEVRPLIKAWAEQYAPIHQVAHWDDRRQSSCGNYDHAYEDAAQAAEKLLLELGGDLAPRFLNHYPAIIWEDQDECLEVQPEDIQPG